MLMREYCFGFPMTVLNPKTENRKPKEIRNPKAEWTLCQETPCEGFEFWRWGDEAGKTWPRGIGRTHGAVWRGDRSRSLAFGENNDADARILLRISVFGFPSDFGFQSGDEAGKTLPRAIGRTYGAVWQGDRSRSLAFGENNDADARILLRISVFGFPSDFGFQISVFETSDFL